MGHTCTSPRGKGAATCGCALQQGQTLPGRPCSFGSGTFSPLLVTASPSCLPPPLVPAPPPNFPSPFPFSLSAVRLNRSRGERMATTNSPQSKPSGGRPKGPSGDEASRSDKPVGGIFWLHWQKHSSHAAAEGNLDWIQCNPSPGDMLVSCRECLPLALIRDAPPPLGLRGGGDI